MPPCLISQHALHTDTLLLLWQLANTTNLTKKERLALKELKSDSERIIRIQDKGSRFVLISRKDYTSKMLDQLQNPLHYRQLSLNPSDDHLNIVQAWCDKWLSEGQISQEIAE